MPSQMKRGSARQEACFYAETAEVLAGTRVRSWDDPCPWGQYRGDFFVASEVVETEGKVRGVVRFPRDGDFEYAGTLPQFLRAVKRQHSGIGVMTMRKITCWVG